MIGLRMKIGDGAIVDSHEEFGMIYLSADNVFSAPEKPRDASSYAGESGEHIDRRAVLAAFDYKVQLLIEAPNRNLTSANAKIKKFNDAIREGSGPVRRCRELTLYSDYKRVKICGVPDLISEATDFYRRADGSVMDCVKVELKLRVENPELCDFDKQALVEEYGLRDLEDRWWGYMPDSNTMSSASDTVRGRTMSVCVRLKRWDIFQLRTYGNWLFVLPWVIVDNLTDKNVLRRSEYANDESEVSMSSAVSYDGILIVNVDVMALKRAMEAGRASGFMVKIVHQDE